MNQKILDREVQEYIINHQEDNIHQILLSGVPFSGVSVQEVVQQIQGRNIVQKKAPSFVIDQMIFPPKLNLEQSSSDLTARYKQKFRESTSQHIIDITGGFGVDLFYFTTSADKISYCDVNSELCEIAQHNFELHKRNIAVHHINGIEFLKQSNQVYDWIYVDPDRRVNKKRVVCLE